MRRQCGWPLRPTRSDGSLAFNALPATPLHHAGDLERLTTHSEQSSGGGAPHAQNQHDEQPCRTEHRACPPDGERRRFVGRAYPASAGMTLPIDEHDARPEADTALPASSHRRLLDPCHPRDGSQ